jgi:hypothetical protein
MMMAVMMLRGKVQWHRSWTFSITITLTTGSTCTERLTDTDFMTTIRSRHKVLIRLSTIDEPHFDVFLYLHLRLRISGNIPNGFCISSQS